MRIRNQRDVKIIDNKMIVNKEMECLVCFNELISYYITNIKKNFL